jgi:hypothetical protein
VDREQALFRLFGRCCPRGTIPFTPGAKYREHDAVLLQRVVEKSADRGGRA